MYSNVNFCSKCGFIFESDDSFCKNCGNNRSREQVLDPYEQHHCSECGELLRSNEKYCPNCGNRSGIPSTVVVDKQGELEKQKLKRENSPFFYLLNLFTEIHAFILGVRSSSRKEIIGDLIGLFILIAILIIILVLIQYFVPAKILKCNRLSCK